VSTVLHKLLDESRDPAAAPDAAELVEMIAFQRTLLEARRPCVPEHCEEISALERTLRLLTEQLQRALPPGGSPLSSLQTAAQLVSPSEFSVPRSHRGGRSGELVTATKRAFVEGLKPLHTELLRPQEGFNRSLVRVLEYLTVHRSLGLREDLEPWIRTQLENGVSPTRWQVRSHRAHTLGSLVGLAKKSYLTALGPLLVGVLRGQAEWNAAMLDVLVASARPGALDEAEATRLVARLDALSDPLRREGLSPGVRATSLLWREVLRRQTRFNSESVLALANILGVRTPPPQPPSLADFDVWCANREPQEIDAARTAVAALTRRPLVSVVVPVRDTPEALLAECLASVEAQVYPEWELVLVDDASSAPHVARKLSDAVHRSARIRTVPLRERSGTARATNAGIEAARGELIAFLAPEDVLAPHALAEAVLALSDAQAPDVVYADEDRLDAQGQRNSPFFKPDWSPDLLRSVDYIGPFVVVRRRTLEAAGGLREGFDGAEGHELLLRLSEGPGRIGHVPRLLCHRRSGPDAPGGVSLEAATRAGCRALTEHLARRGEPAEVSSPAPGRYRVRYALQGEPKVSIIVPFKDRPDLLQTLVSSLLERTAYRNYEVLLVSNNSTRPETFALLERLTDPRLVKLTWDFPFNYPAINNWAARQATGELLLFLNNDMEVVDPGWLDELVGQAQRPEVGAVGAKLLFPEGTVQHAGVVVGITGFAGHPFWRLPDGPISTPFGHTEWTRNWLSVTSACVILRRQVFESLGGFDERFQVCGSDVELGLRLHARGLRVVSTAFARLIHHESASRRTDAIPEADYWLSFAAYRPWLGGRGDPFYNPNLSLLSVDCDLRRHEESGETLAVRTLGRDVPSARDARVEKLAREQRHFMEHLGELDFSSSEREEHRRRAPEALAALRSRGRVETATWFIPSFGHIVGGIQTILRFADHLRRRHGVRSTFIIYDQPDARAADYAAKAAVAFPEGVGEFRVLRNQDELASLPACDLAIATYWTSAFPVLRHPRAVVRAYFVQDDEPPFLAAGTQSALAEQTYGLGLYGIFNTEGLYDYAARQYGMEGVAFEPAVDGALFHGKRPARKGPVRVFFHGHPGNERNGFELGLAALAALKRELGAEVEILSAGADWNPESYGVRGLVTNLGVLPAERTAALYRECDVGLCLVFTRHPSSPPLEMMASGVTVIAHDNPAHHWLLKHGENCLLAAPTLTCVLEQLRRAVREPELRAGISSRASARMRQGSWEAAVDGVMDALLGRARHRQGSERAIGIP
jgi:GT2 family glycosyltransferase